MTLPYLNLIVGPHYGVARMNNKLVVLLPKDNDYIWRNND